MLQLLHGHWSDSRHTCRWKSVTLNSEWYMLLNLEIKKTHNQLCSIYRVIEIEIEDSLAIVDLASNLISISFFFAEKPSGVCGGVRVPNFRFIIDGWVVGERHNLNQEHHLAHTATPILASLLITRQKHTRERQKKEQNLAQNFSEMPFIKWSKLQFYVFR